MKITLAILVVALGAFSLPRATEVRLQTTACTLTKTETKDLRGFHLGMRWQQVVAQFPGTLRESMNARQVKLLPSGDCYVLNQLNRESISHFKPEKYSVFNEVSSIVLRFFEGEIVFIQVTYDGATHWRTLDDFAAKISDGLSLPNAWQRGAYAAQRAMNCNGFNVSASLESTCKMPGFCGRPDIYLPTVAFEDTTVADRAIENLRQQREEQERREEQKRKVFKP